MKKICTLCKIEKDSTEFYLKRNIFYTARCKNCIRKKRAEYVSKNLNSTRKSSRNYYYKYRKYNLKSEYRDRCFKTGLDGFLATICKSSLARREGNIDRFFLKELWDKQGGLCALSGEKMTSISGMGKVYTNVSIDRIDNKKGYERENVRLLCVGVNIMRSYMNDEQFINLCKKIIQCHLKKENKI